jgi:hypothetical protein
MSVDLSMRYHVLWKGTRQDGWQKGQGYERSQAGEADDGWMDGWAGLVRFRDSLPSPLPVRCPSRTKETATGQ